MSQKAEQILTAAYAAFNAGDIDSAIELMHPDVDWPNAWEGGRIRGQSAVRRYWERQLGAIASRVEPERFSTEPDGGVTVDVHQVVQDAETGELLADSRARHRYRFADDLIVRMEVMEPESSHHARIRWSGGEEKDIRAHTIELAEQQLAASSAPEFRGDPAKADPEELFVASLSSCHMLWFLALARAEQIGVSSYEDEPEGKLDGKRFTRVVLRPRVDFDGEVDGERVASLHHRAHELCFIANSVSCPVEVEPQATSTYAAPTVGSGND